MRRDRDGARGDLSSGRSACRRLSRVRLENHDRSLLRTGCCVAVEVLVQLPPALPQSFAFDAERGPADDLASRPTRKVEPGDTGGRT